MPAEAGIQVHSQPNGENSLDSRVRGNDGREGLYWGQEPFFSKSPQRNPRVP